MMHLLRWVLLTVLVPVLFASNLVWSADEKAKPKTYVVLVGVGGFADTAIQARPTAENDAKALYDLFVSTKYLGVEKSDVRLVLGVEDKSHDAKAATKESIVKAFKWAADKADKNDLVIFGLFGRGAPTGDRTCFFLPDSTVKNRAKDALATADLEQELAKIKSEKVLALVDIDYKGFTTDKQSLAEPNLLDMVKVFVGQEDAEEHQLPPGRIIFLASNNVARHIDTPENGLFAKTVLDALHGKADVEGYEPDGVVTVDELQQYLDTQVIAQARILGKTNEEKQQTPLVWGTRSNRFVLTKNPDIFPKTEARIAALSKLDLPEQIIEEGTRLIGRMPKLKAQQELRKNYVKLADGGLKVDEFTEARKKIQATMKLDKEDAETFARKTLAGLEKVQRRYVKDLHLGEMVQWAVKGMYKGLDENVPGDILTQLNDARSMRRGQLADLLADSRERLGKREDLEKNKDVDLAIKRAMFNLDPYTTYYDEEAIAQMQSQMTGQFTGIGVQIRRDMVRDGLLVVTPIKGSPAYKAGMKAGDLIVEMIRPVDNKGKRLDPPEVISTKGMKTDEAVKKILGQPRTEVIIKVMREGHDKPIEFKLDRARVDVETVFGVKRKDDDSWDFTIDKEKKIAYIRLTQFSPRSFEDMHDAVKKLSADGVKGVILDLRYNPGGLLTSAIQISDLFIDDGLIVTIKPRSSVDDEHPYGGRSKDSYLKFPMVCMINGMSASGSEIVAACLQDHQRAIILGERSYGKGSVQDIEDFPATHAKIKLTTATFWRPNGKNLNKSSTSGKEEDEWGVKPDEGFNVPMARAERDALFDYLHEQEIIPNRELKPKEPKPEVKDKQLEAALEYMRSQIKPSGSSAKKNG
jgi:carboxyl-terminal processing protease